MERYIEKEEESVQQEIEVSDFLPGRKTFFEPCIVLRPPPLFYRPCSIVYLLDKFSRP